MNLNEVRKEDDLYYEGAFWIKGNSVRDIKKGNYEIIGIKIPCNYMGTPLTDRSKRSLTHLRLWPEYNKGLENKPYNYLPRGRVAIYNGVAYIHLNSLFNQPDLVDKLEKEYNLGKLEIDLDFNDTYQGSHYDFLLK